MILTAALALLAAGTVSADAGTLAPAPLYRDPVHDGAADPSVVYDPRAGKWVMFYTNRRADMELDDSKDVRWVHGTAIGIARSKDGADWRYAGTAKLPSACTGETLWAPDVLRVGKTWHMWVTVVPGIYRDWNAPRRIVHLASDDLRTWTCSDAPELGSDRVIDAEVMPLPTGGFRMYFNDERKGKSVRFADSDDLINWSIRDTVIQTPGEGPVAFQWKGSVWLISDAWKGLLVMRSQNGANWTKQENYLLDEPGVRLTDRAKGQHPDVVVVGDRAWLFYFVQQSGEPEAAGKPGWGRRSVIQVTELHECDGQLSVSRDEPSRILLPAED
ncbi:glycoside hydrolase family 43 [Qipengyuania sp.]|uniref:glycoside hydrolase family 43 n=1 Tax=Qipengyuania sp. TaxID=2004515 RepID=UPI0035C7B39E